MLLEARVCGSAFWQPELLTLPRPTWSLTRVSFTLTTGISSPFLLLLPWRVLGAALSLTVFGVWNFLLMSSQLGGKKRP